MKSIAILDTKVMRIYNYINDLPASKQRNNLLMQISNLLDDTIYNSINNEGDNYVYMTYEIIEQVNKCLKDNKIKLDIIQTNNIILSGRVVIK